MYHDRIDVAGFKEKFSDEIINFEKLTNKKSKGFRAPTFSLNKNSSWIVDSLVKHGTIGAEDLDLFEVTDTVDEAFDFITKSLEEKSLMSPSGIL